LIEFARSGIPAIKQSLQRNRVLFVHGEVDLPYQSRFNRCFDTISFNWQMVARRIASDLAANGWSPDLDRQTIFEAQWKPGDRTTW
jgi:hypothetical protein